MKERLARFVKFVAEVRAELGRASWPSWTEVRGTTLVVVMTSLIFAAYLFVVDYSLRRAIDYLFATLAR